MTAQTGQARGTDGEERRGGKRDWTVWSKLTEKNVKCCKVWLNSSLNIWAFDISRLVWGYLESLRQNGSKMVLWKEEQKKQ